jgi:hypothetical protein
MMSLKGLCREQGFRGFSAKAEGKGDCSPPAKAGGNMKTGTIWAGAIWRQWQYGGSGNMEAGAI